MRRGAKDWRVYLQDIRDAVDCIAQYTRSGKRTYMQQGIIQDAVIRQLSIIGEAASRLPRNVRDRHPDIPWKGAIGMRNVLIHDYGQANMQRV